MQYRPLDFHIAFHAVVQRCSSILLSSRGEDVTAVAGATVAFLVALVLVLERPFIVQNLVVPLAVTSLHPGRMPTLEGIAAIENFVRVMGGIAAIAGSLLLGYACLWRYVALRLPRSVGLPREAVTSSVSALEISCLLLSLIVAYVCRVHYMTRGLSFDEITAAMYYVDTDSLWQIISTDHLFSNHIANSVLAHFSQCFFGRSEWALRLPAFLLGLISLYTIWFVTRRILGQAPALLAVCVLSLSPAHVYLSTSARGYAGMLLFTFLSNYYYYKLLQYPARRDSIFFILSSVTAIYFHLFSAFVVIPQVIFLLYLAHRQIAAHTAETLLTLPALRAISLAFVAIVGLSLMSYALVLPLYSSTFHALQHGDFNLYFPLDVVTFFSYGYDTEISHGVLWLLVLVIFCTVIIGFVVLSKSHPTIGKYLMVLFAIPFLILIPARPYYLFERYLLFLLPYYMVLLGSGVLALWQMASKLRGRLRCVSLRALYLTLAVVILSIWSVHTGIVVAQEGGGGGYREAARALEKDTPSSTGVCAIGFGGRRLQYYFKASLFMPPNVEAFEQFVISHSEIKCADATIGVPEEPAYLREIAAFLAHHAKAQTFGGVVVYTYP